MPANGLNMLNSMLELFTVFAISYNQICHTIQNVFADMSVRHRCAKGESIVLTLDYWVLCAKNAFLLEANM